MKNSHAASSDRADKSENVVLPVVAVDRCESSTENSVGEGLVVRFVELLSSEDLARERRSPGIGSCESQLLVLALNLALVVRRTDVERVLVIVGSVLEQSSFFLRGGSELLGEYKLGVGPVLGVEQVVVRAAL